MDRGTDSASPSITSESSPDAPVGGDDGETGPIVQSRFDVLRCISDREVRQHGDLALAVRYYARALNGASAEQRAISIEEDNWLLLALKEARMEESHDENTDG